MIASDVVPNGTSYTVLALVTCVESLWDKLLGQSREVHMLSGTVSAARSVSWSLMMIINGLVISGEMENLLDNDRFHSPQDTESFRALVEPYFPGNAHDLIKDFRFYPRGLIQGETMGLYKWFGGGDQIMMLGKRDESQKPGNLDPAKAVLMGDFGIGSDTGIAMDYRENIVSPRILIHVWGRRPEAENKWVVLTNTFEEFLSESGYR